MNRTFLPLVFLGLFANHGLGLDQPAAPAQPGTGTSSSVIILKEDFIAADFAKALVGRWISVFMHPGGDNVLQADFLPDGNAVIIILRQDVKERIAGRYRLEFEREPGAGAVTFARITISGEGKDLILSRVNFGLHNGVHQDVGLLLRVNREPFGAMKKTSQQPVGDNVNPPTSSP